MTTALHHVMKKLAKKTNIEHQSNDELSDINKQLYERNLELAIRNRTLSTQRKMYEIMNTSLGVQESAQKLIKAIVHEFQFPGGAISLLNEKKNHIYTAGIAGKSSLSKKDQQVLNEAMTKEISVKNAHNIVAEVVKKGIKKSTNNLHDLLVPFVTQEKSKELMSVLTVQTFMLYPIRFGNKTLGALILGMDKKIHDLSRAEREALSEIIDVVGIAIERAQIYTDLKIANVKLKELDQMKDDFVSVASHELRTPMTAIKSYLWLALDGRGGKVSTKLRYYLDRAYTSTDRLIKLVNDMLNISRIESGRITIELSKVDLVAVAKSVIEEVKPRADELGVKVMLSEKYKSIPAVLADPDKIKEVFFNLIGNSLKFTDKGGKVEVIFSHPEESGGKLLNIAIKDNGHGIDPKDMNTLFTKFGMVEGSYATNKKASGTGLGLFICKSIVELHRGSMLVQSDGIGKGATFSFTLPIYKKGSKKTIKPKKSLEERKLGIVHSSIY